mgnify:FL=1
MSEIIYWEEYYTREEMDEIMYSYIRETAKELEIELKNVDNKNLAYV